MQVDQRSAHSSGWETAEVVFGAALLTGLILGFLYPLRLSTWIPRAATLVAGIAFLVAGLAVVTITRRQFRAAAQPTDPGFPTTRLITHGVFSWSRNPLYLAGMLIFLALGMLLNSLWLLVLAIPTIVALHLVLIVPEERYLAAKFGPAYYEYARSVRRWIGRRQPRL